jgi:hypothetical protein
MPAQKPTYLSILSLHMSIIPTVIPIHAPTFHSVGNLIQAREATHQELSIIVSVTVDHIFPMASCISFGIYLSISVGLAIHAVAILIIDLSNNCAHLSLLAELPSKKLSRIIA